MSWDADLIDDRTGVSIGEWNFTHNTSPMIYVALVDQGVDLLDLRPVGTPWYHHLHGMTGPAGARFLNTIIRGLEADPARFEALNPLNGWGDYESLVKVLTDMRNRVPEWPTTWEASG